VNYTSSYTDTDPTLGTTDCLDSWFPRLPHRSFTDVDLFAMSTSPSNCRSTPIVLNVFDRGAPYDPQAAYGQNNYNFHFRRARAIGRFYDWASVHL